MKKTNTKTLLGISIATILAISVVSVSGFPDAFATKSVASGKPDFIANFETYEDPNGELNDQSFRAMFWVDGVGDDMKIAYKVILNKIDVGQNTDPIPNKNPGVDGNNGKGLTHFLWKLHVHPAPEGSHDKTVHHFNIVGPHDDPDLKIAGNTLTGIWNMGDTQTLGNSDHQSVAPNTVIDQMCNSNTDINVHLQNATNNSELEIRGQIYPNSDYCD